MKKVLLFLACFLIVISVVGCGSTKSGYTVSGYVYTNGEVGVPDVPITLSNGTSTTTDANGHWSKSGLKGSVDINAEPLNAYYVYPGDGTVFIITVTGSKNDVNFMDT